MNTTPRTIPDPQLSSAFTPLMREMFTGKSRPINRAQRQLIDRATPADFRAYIIGMFRKSKRPFVAALAKDLNATPAASRAVEGLTDKLLEESKKNQLLYRRIEGLRKEYNTLACRFHDLSEILSDRSAGLNLTLGSLEHLAFQFVEENKLLREENQLLSDLVKRGSAKPRKTESGKPAHVDPDNVGAAVEPPGPSGPPTVGAAPAVVDVEADAHADADAVAPPRNPGSTPAPEDFMAMLGHLDKKSKDK
jgi:hypothetical protein